MYIVEAEGRRLQAAVNFSKTSALPGDKRGCSLIAYVCTYVQVVLLRTCYGTALTKLVRAIGEGSCMGVASGNLDLGPALDMG